MKIHRLLVHTRVCVCVCVCIHTYIWGFPGGSVSEESTCNSGDLVSISELGRSPREGNGYPLHYSCLENPSHGQRNLAGYSARGHKDSDTTERLSTHTNDVCVCIYIYIYIFCGNIKLCQIRASLKTNPE